MSNPTTLGDALPAECARVRKILGHYREIGPAGAFGAHMIEQDLAAADRAMISGSLPEMMTAYMRLKEIEA